MRAIPFSPFDPAAPTKVYYGNLPHWRQDGCTYFVTFRLADAMPPAVIRLWREARDTWLIGQGVMSSRDRNWRKACARLDDEQRVRFEQDFSSALDRHLDAGHGACLLRSHEHAAIVGQTLMHVDQDRCDVGDWVVMANHTHVLVRPYPGNKLENILKSVKGFSSRQLNARTGNSGAIWQSESYDHIVRGTEDLKRIQRYIAQNPQKAGVSGTMPREAVRAVRWRVTPKREGAGRDAGTGMSRPRRGQGS